MRDFYIIDIPVYLQPKDQYYKNREAATIRHLGKLFPGVESPREKYPTQCQIIEHEFHKTFGGPWDFNQVVGWLKLYAEGSTIGAHLWWVDAKRLQTRMRKTFYLTTFSDALASWFKPEDSSERIFSETINQIEALAKQRIFKGKHIDLVEFRNLGPFIDWRGLMDAAAKGTIIDPP
jgi:hypothetical protein